MLKIYFGNMENAILSGDGYFDAIIDEEIIETEIGKKIIGDIEKGEVISRNNIIIPVYGGISPNRLSGGVKSLLSLASDSSIVLDLACMGNNCFRSLSEVVKNADGDITVCSDSLRPLYDKGYEGEIYVINTGVVVSSQDALRKEWMKTL